MDIVRAVYKVRPGVQWINDSVNAFSIDMVKAAYVGDDFPSDGELETAWVECLKNDKKSEAKDEAYKRIINILPEWKQRNYTAMSVELTEKKVDGVALTQEEVAVLDTIKSAWGLIQNIRSASDSIEAEIEALSLSSELEIYEINNNPLWP